MKKLLHERLREIDDDSSNNDFKFTDDDYIWMPEYEAVFLADEIERYYIPRPRFEDGEPVQFGDSVIGERVTWIVKVGADAVDQNIEEMQGSVEGYEYDEDGGTWLRITDDYGELFSVRPPEGADYFKRPSPKVLDADGVEIKVGDTVYFQNDPTPHIVEIARSFNVKTTDGHQYPHPDKHLTHKEPDSIQKVFASICDEVARREMNDTTRVMSEWADRLAALIGKVGA